MSRITLKPFEHLLNETKVQCPHCHLSHKAVVFIRDKRVYGRIDCDNVKEEILLSSHADSYQKIHQKSAIPVGSTQGYSTQKTILEFIEITKACNFRCPICYVSCSPSQKESHLNVKDIIAKAKEAKKRGSIILNITGGEATEHPDLLTIIKEISALNIKMVMPTNGLTLGKNPQLAISLKKAGLHQVAISFDSFDPLTHQKMRGNQFISEKLQAIKNVKAAHLKFSLITTVTPFNLHEVANIAAFALENSPFCEGVVFQLAAPVGRFEVTMNEKLFREDVIYQLSTDPRFSSYIKDDNFWPLPSYAPWGLHQHPDCGVNCYLFVEKGQRPLPIDTVISLGHFYKKLQATLPGDSFYKKKLLPLLYILQSTPLGAWKKLFLHVFGKFKNTHLRNQNKKTLFYIATGSYVCDEFRDESRLAHCPTLMSGEHEGTLSPCARFSNEKSQHGFY